MCLDYATGRIVWQHRFPADRTESHYFAASVLVDAGQVLVATWSTVRAYGLLDGAPAVGATPAGVDQLGRDHRARDPRAGGAVRPQVIRRERERRAACRLLPSCGMARRGSKLCGSLLVLLALGAACGSGRDGGESATPESDAGVTSPATPAPGPDGGAPPVASGGATIHHVLATGQSNAVGFNATPVLSTSQPAGNLSFDVGVMTATACDGEGCRGYESPSRLVPLVEGDGYDDGPVETMSSGFANLASALARERHDLLVTVHGRSGWVYECMRKGSCTYRTELGYLPPFEEGMRQVDDAITLARAVGRPLVVEAVTAVHGESDHYVPFPTLASTDGTPGAVSSYADALLEWQRDYEAGIQQRTGQTERIPLLVSQLANWNDRTTSEIPTRQLEAHVRGRGAVVLVGPTYMLPYGRDCIHFTSEGQRLLGQYFAKAYARVVHERGTWEPLRPISAQLDRDAITLRYAVKAPPLVLDTTAVVDPGGAGFVFDDGSGSPPRVVGVDVLAADTVRIRLAAVPSGRAPHLRYALDATPGTCPGPASGPRGNVRDSDATLGPDGAPLPNWSVAFDWAF